MVSKAGFWLVRGSPRTARTTHLKRSGIFEQKRSCATEEAFGAEHPHDLGHRVVEERHSHRVADRHLAVPVGQKSAVPEGAHRVGPGLARAVHEATVDPARYLVHLD